MDSKNLIWVFMSIGMFVGGLIPTMFGASEFSFSSVIFSSLGGILGIVIAFKLTR